ncbi:type III pantothenate kinase [Marinomonas rhizomae]|uniref:Type III pantothenate kinase n=1 Tax=Marinomonas rhizomae TaxID=491948 RepID=A0A366IV22_9GAMM|nr:type III pantothenate kinase [Marinomonas rhizomae]RBP78636.1 type III pantothenate kinase [Marinomonas rhizomae]RNF70713.1 type III pantothenate kinase [Marinomonas rhizomae]
MSVVSRVLIVDAGNTSIKFTAFEGEQVLWVERGDGCPTESGFVPEVIYFASVRSKEQSALLHADIQAEFPQSDWVTLTSQAFACGVSNAYVEPERLGIDRWLGVIAAHHLVKSDVVVVDAGTAIKVDVVNKEGVHLGGYIAAGLAMMEDALLSKTARIRYGTDEVVTGQGLPNSTARAVVEGGREMVLGFLERIYHRYPEFKWVVTGGDAQELLDSLGVSLECQPNLVALGARLVGDEQLRGNK